MLLDTLSSSLSTRRGLAIGGLAVILAGTLIGCNGNSSCGGEGESAPPARERVAAQVFPLEQVKAFELGREWVGLVTCEGSKGNPMTGVFRRWLAEEATRPEGKVKSLTQFPGKRSKGAPAEPLLLSGQRGSRASFTPRPWRRFAGNA